jgi:hypothetical protein
MHSEEGSEDQMVYNNEEETWCGGAGDNEMVIRKGTTIRVRIINYKIEVGQIVRAEPKSRLSPALTMPLSLPSERDRHNQGGLFRPAVIAAGPRRSHRTLPQKHGYKISAAVYQHRWRELIRTVSSGSALPNFLNARLFSHPNGACKALGEDGALGPLRYSRWYCRERAPRAAYVTQLWTAR